MKIEIRALGIQIWRAPRRDLHPHVEMTTQQQDWNKKDCQHRQQDGDVCQLTAYNDGPVSVGGVVNDCPEEAAGAERKEEHKRKEPGVTELMRVHECADKAEHQAHNGNQTKES